MILFLQFHKPWFLSNHVHIVSCIVASPKSVILSFLLILQENHTRIPEEKKTNLMLSVSSHERSKDEIISFALGGLGGEGPS